MVRNNSNILSSLLSSTIVTFLVINSLLMMIISVTGFSGRSSTVFTTTTASTFSVVKNNSNNCFSFLESTQGDEKENDKDNKDEDEDEDAQQQQQQEQQTATNVLGTELECCCSNVRETGIGTGFYRNGYCVTGVQDLGKHTVCVQVTEEFLKYSQAIGNDLSTPIPQYMFPGLTEGDVWCLCAKRWVQALQYGMAPKLYLRSTHEKTLNYVSFTVLRTYALDGNEADTEKEQLDLQRNKIEQIFDQKGE
mmetsp:Transcript_30936/g.34650  ORF Transcript_30936/g.34650 Transcript_30936/m.34650 type:complete len:250 (+) Transcript_30936:158-907(+)